MPNLRDAAWNRRVHTGRSGREPGNFGYRYEYPGGWTVQKERLLNGAVRWRLERNGRLVSHYRTMHDAERHGPRLDVRFVPWIGSD